MNENMEFPGATGEYIEWLQDSFVSLIREQVEKDKNDPFVKREQRGKVSQLIYEKCISKIDRSWVNPTLKGWNARLKMTCFPHYFRKKYNFTEDHWQAFPFPFHETHTEKIVAFFEQALKTLKRRHNHAF